MNREQTRMLLVDTASTALGEATVAALPELLRPDDLLVVNDAATLPASVWARTEQGEALEVRLLDGPHTPFTRAVLFGSGDYRTPTEHRAPPPRFLRGATLSIDSLRLRVAHVADASPRLVMLHWPGSLEERFETLYRAGRPVQYSYEPEPLPLWEVQTVFASRPWAVEMPSAARPLSAALLMRLRQRGVEIARLTHAAGLSSTGDAALDAQLPLPELYEIPESTVALVERTRRRGGRIIAVGTSVVRALEDSALRYGGVRAGRAWAELVLGPSTPRRVTDGLLTGIHSPGESHYQLLSAFTDAATLANSVKLAEARGYRAHEFGESALLVPQLPIADRLAA